MVTQARLTVFWVVFNNGLRRCESKQKRHGLSMFKSDALTHRHTRFLYIKSTIYSLASEARPSTCTPNSLIRLFFRFWSCCQKELFNFDHFLTHILLSRRLICSVFFRQKWLRDQTCSGVLINSIDIVVPNTMHTTPPPRFYRRCKLPKVRDKPNIC